jgi:hypothetical protein
VPFTITKVDKHMMNLNLDLSSISEEKLKKYLNDRGEGILSMFINNTLAD